MAKDGLGKRWAIRRLLGTEVKPWSPGGEGRALQKAEALRLGWMIRNDTAASSSKVSPAVYALFWSDDGQSGN
jgi:hypothetical protein